MRALVRGVRGLCGVLCGAETRAAIGLCGVCGVRPYVCARLAPSACALVLSNESRTYAAPHTPHAPHRPRRAYVSAVRGPVRGPRDPAQAARTRAGAGFPPFVPERVGRGGNP
jgi:hypothetical protein